MSNRRINAQPVMDGPWPDCKGFEELTVASTAVGLASVPENASIAVISVETSAIRYRSGGTPTATTGMPLPAGSILTYTSDIATLRFIAQGSAAKLSVEYF